VARVEWVATIDDPQLLATALAMLSTAGAAIADRLADLYDVAPGADRWLDIRELARLMRCSVSTIEHLPPDAIPGRRQVRRGSRVRWRERDVRAWMASQGSIA